MLRRSKNKRRAPADEPDDGPTNIIVLGDDADARELLARVLIRAGHEVEQVDRTSVALESVAEQHHLALLALLRDDRATELMTDLRAHDDPQVAALPALVVTDDDSSATSATKAGADGTLTRPFHADELTDALKAVLDQSAEQRAEARAGAALRRDD